MPTKPEMAILEFANKSENQWWWRGGAETAQNTFETELTKSGRFKILDCDQLRTILADNNLKLTGDIDASIAIKAGKILRVQYLLTGTLMEYEKFEKHDAIARMKAKLIDTSSGEVEWMDEVHRQVPFSGNPELRKDEDRAFNEILKPVIHQLVASLKSAGL